MLRDTEELIPLPAPRQRHFAAVGGDGIPEKQFLMRGTAAFRLASLALFLAGFSTFSLLYCVQPLMPVFTADFGVTPAASSLSLSLSTGFLAFAIFGASALSERFGRRGLMVCSLLGASLCNIACSMVTDWQLVLATRALEGFLLGGIPAVAMTYLSEEVHPAGLGASMGLYIAGNAFGGMAGRVVTAILAEHFSWQAAMAAIGVLGLAAAFGLFLLLPPSRNFVARASFDPRFHVHAWGRHMRNPALPLLFLIGFLVMGAFVTIYNYIGFRLVAPPYNLNQTELGLLFVIYLCGIAASWSAGVLGDRLGHFAVLRAGVALAALGVTITLATPLLFVTLGIILLTMGFFIAHSAASTLVGALARDTKGHASALYLLAYYVGSSVSGSLGGHFWATSGWSAVAGFTLALLVLALAAAFTAGSRLTRPAM